MVKLNRIGNKLGLAGALGLLLAGGMVVNQLVTQERVADYIGTADRAQRVEESVLAAHIRLRQIQISGRTIRLARTAAEVDANIADVRRFTAQEEEEIEGAYNTTTKAESKERLAKIKALMASYVAGVEELAKVQRDLLAQIEKRNAISSEWTKAVETALKSSSLAHVIGTTDLENFLYQADARVSSLRALAWRFGVTGENLSESIGRTSAALNEVFKEARLKSNEKEFVDLVARLESIVKRFLATNEAVIRDEAEKEDIVQNRSVKFVNEAGGVIEGAVTSAKTSNSASKEQAAAETASANRISLLMSLAVMASITGSVLFSFFGVGRPMTRLNAALARMAAGEVDIRIPGADRGDEIGDLAKTVVVIGENAAQKARQEAEAKASEDELHARQRKVEMVKLADSFEGAVGEIVQTVSAASLELETAAGTLTTTADRSQELTLAVAGASEQASANVQSVASASEELSSSVREISRQVQESARMATGAVDQARATNDRVSELSKAAGRIGDVVALINTIAEQTNLLALNATIEAARAGDAGRGFAVVASEVKALAEQTSKATGEIGQQITGIQAATEESVGAIREISGTIERLAEVSSAIAAAVEEQGAATQEIARNVQQASRGTQQVSANISDVRRGTEETGSASTKVLSAAQMLSKDSGRLKAQVARFLESIRAA